MTKIDVQIDIDIQNIKSNSPNVKPLFWMI